MSYALIIYNPIVPTVMLCVNRLERILKACAGVKDVQTIIAKSYEEFPRIRPGTAIFLVDSTYNEFTLSYLEATADRVVLIKSTSSLTDLELQVQKEIYGK